jgi:hypothetical protein
MSRAESKRLVLALHPFTRGLAFALFEAPLSPIDWSIKDVRGKQKNARMLEAAKKLIEQHQPDVLVLEECVGPHTRRGGDVRRLLKLIANHGVGQSIEVHTYARASIRECFRAVGATTRYEIAQAIASQIAAFGHQLPPLRKLWMSEDVRMGLFDAVSLVMTFYRHAGGVIEEPGGDS